MAHPSNLIGKNPHYIVGAQTATLAEGDYFHTITVLADAVLTVKGSGIFVYLESGAGGTGHIDPDTGVAHTGDTDEARFYEALGTTGVAITIPAGVTIYGRFTEIASSSSDISIAYK
tara:strand:- start:665 stop:1015 length:351 start_codon:yes stop_codon:yes gene_type:complete